MSAGITTGYVRWMLVLGCALALAGCSTAHYRRSADKDAYQAIAQKTPAVTNMEPHFTIEQTNALALDDLPVAAQTNEFLGQAAGAESGARVLSLEKVLEIAVHHSRSYQASKEQLYLAALSLSLSRHQLAPIFSGGGNGAYTVTTAPVSVSSTNPVSGEVTLTDHMAETHSVS